MRTYTISLQDDEAALLDEVLSHLNGSGITPEAWLEGAAVDALNGATSDAQTFVERERDALDRAPIPPPVAKAQEGLPRLARPFSQLPPEARPTWFLQIGRTLEDIRTFTNFQEIAMVEISAKHLRILRHILSGHRHRFEFLICEAFNKAMEQTLDAIQAAQWRESQKRKAIDAPTNPEGAEA